MSELLFIAELKKQLYDCYSKEQLSNYPIVSVEEFLNNSSKYIDTKYIFSTWGAPRLSEEQIKKLLPDLKAVFYAAGTVQQFAHPYLNCGVKVFSAWAANAIPVSEFATAQIVLANKGYFQTAKRYKEDGYEKTSSYCNTFPGNYDVDVGLLGAGMIGRKVVELLKPYKINVKVFDPFLSEEKAKEMGVVKTTLEDIFSTCQTISNHLANNEKTKGMLDYKLFSKMKKNATFINTGRNAQVVVKDLIKAMREEPQRTALLDVTDPTEPLSKEDELFKVENILITTHRAGSATSEIKRMGEYMFDQYDKFTSGKACEYEVTKEMLKTMA